MGARQGGRGGERAGEGPARAKARPAAGGAARAKARPALVGAERAKASPAGDGASPTGSRAGGEASPKGVRAGGEASPKGVRAGGEASPKGAPARGGASPKGDGAREAATSAKGGRGRRRTYHHGALREALLGAALELIESGDVAALSLREVARRAGVTSAAPYHHFKDKNALLAAVAIEGFRRLDALTAAVRAGAREGSAATLEELLGGYVRFASEHPAHFRVMFLPELHGAGGSELEAAAEACFAALVGVLAAVRPGAGPERRSEVAGVGFAAAHGLAMLARKGSLWAKVSPRGLPGAIAAAARALLGALDGAASAGAPG